MPRASGTLHDTQHTRTTPVLYQPLHRPHPSRAPHQDNHGAQGAGNTVAKRTERAVGLRPTVSRSSLVFSSVLLFANLVPRHPRTGPPRTLLPRLRGLLLHLGRVASWFRSLSDPALALTSPARPSFAGQASKPPQRNTPASPPASPARGRHGRTTQHTPTRATAPP